MACGAEQEAPTKRSQTRTRWPILALLCTCLIGSYYCYDGPSATLNQLEDYFVGTNTTVEVDDDGASTDTNSFSFKFNMLYSVYSWPNVILPFFGGFISDKLGVRLTTVVFAMLITLGQAIFALGASLGPTDTAWYVMFLGRVVFGFGGESLSVAQSAMVAQWFQGKELAFALGANLALARVGSVINDVASVRLAIAYEVYWAYWVGLIVCGVSLVCAVLTFYLDKATEDRIRKNAGLRPKKESGLLSLVFCVPLFRGLCGCKDRVDEEEGDALTAGDYEEEPPTEEIHMSAVLKFPATFWCIALSCITCYCAILPFNGIAGGFVAQKYLTDMPLWKVPDDQKSNLYVTANNILLSTYLMAGFLSPLLGGVIDKVGLRAVLNVLAAAFIVGVHLVLALTKLYPLAPLIFLGVTYSIYAAALWPSIAIVIPPAYQATAYGVVTAVQNLGLAVAPLVIGTLMPPANCATYDICVSYYTKVEYFFVGLGAAGVLCGVALNIADKAAPYPLLNLSESAIQKLRDADAAAAGDDVEAVVATGSGKGQSLLHDE